MTLIKTQIEYISKILFNSLASKRPVQVKTKLLKLVWKIIQSKHTHIGNQEWFHKKWIGYEFKTDQSYHNWTHSFALLLKLIIGITINFLQLIDI